MLSLKAITSFLAVAGSMSFAFPTTPVPSVEVAKRGIAFPPYELAARAALTARVDGVTPPISIPDVLDLAKAALKPILAELEAAIAAKAGLDVLVPIWAKIAAVLKDFSLGLGALPTLPIPELPTLPGVPDIPGVPGLPLTPEATAKLLVDLLTELTMKLKATLALLSPTDLLLFGDAFTSVLLPIISSLEGILKLVPALKTSPDIKALVDSLLAIALSLGVLPDIIARLKGLLPI